MTQIAGKGGHRMFGAPGSRPLYDYEMRDLILHFDRGRHVAFARKKSAGHWQEKGGQRVYTLN